MVTKAYECLYCNSKVKLQKDMGWQCTKCGQRYDGRDDEGPIRIVEFVELDPYPTREEEKP